jgi:predicted transcriptional regulator
MSESVEITMADKIDAALSEMIANNEKINVSQVAKRLGISNSAIYKFNPEKIPDIQTAQKQQKNKAEAIAVGTENEQLKKEVESLKKSNLDYKALAEDLRTQNQSLWEHIQQVYNMYDEVLAERNGFAERLKHGL